MPGHVVFLECYPHVRGGAQATTATLAKGLDDRGWTCEVVSVDDGSALAPLRASGVPTTVLHASHALRRYGGVHRPADRARAALALPAWTTRLARHLRSVDADLLDVVDQRGVVLGAPAAALARVRGVWHVHTPGPRSPIDTVGRRWARVCIAPSRGAAQQVSIDTVVIPPAVTHIEMSDRSVARTSARIVSAGRLHPMKGFDVLIDAVALLAPRCPTVVLDIYGDAQVGHEAHADALRAQITLLGLRDSVHLRGHLPSPWHAWDDAALYVQPSRGEPFGMALAEAMAYGLPVIATEVSGPQELIDNERTGLLVPPNDPAALACAIERLVIDRELADRLARAGQAFVRDTYTEDRLIEHTAAAFERALA